MIQSIDLNCDMGESVPGFIMNFDDNILPYISSCNISCGGHSGTDQVITHTIESAVHQNVSIGAHPSYPDKENFGRKSLSIEWDQLRSAILYQFDFFFGKCQYLDAEVKHVKAHGALYNDMVKNVELASQFLELVQDYGSHLKIYGMAHSHIESASAGLGIDFINEVFADRRYSDKTTLKSRAFDDAVLTTPHDIFLHLDHLLEGTLIDESGRAYDISPETICLHSDTLNAIELAKEIRTHIIEKGVKIEAP